MTEEQYQQLLAQVNANAQAIEEIKEVLAELGGGTSPAGVDSLTYCNCEEKWTTLYTEDLPAITASIPKVSLDGTELVITKGE